MRAKKGTPDSFTRVKDATRRAPRPESEVMSARKSIRNFCIQCMGMTTTAAAEVDQCTAKRCWLYPWRFGSTPPGFRDKQEKGEDN